MKIRLHGEIVKRRMKLKIELLVQGHEDLFGNHTKTNLLLGGSQATLGQPNTPRLKVAKVLRNFAKRINRKMLLHCWEFISLNKV